MSIPLPHLDDRRWSDLVEQGRALLPLYAPSWTDHNASDPGITLMELLAWVAEQDLYRVNRLSARQKGRLLHLLDVHAAPPRAALLAIEARLAPGHAPVTVPAGAEWLASTSDGRTHYLRSTSTVTLADAALSAVQRGHGPAFVDVTAAWTRGDDIPLFGVDPAPGDTLYLGFDRPLPTSAWTQLVIVDASPAAGESARSALRAEQPAGTLRHHDARLSWEALAAGGAWVPLDVEDDTRACSLSGAVRLRPRSAMTAASVGAVPRELHYVRARLGGGAFDAAPQASRIWLNGVVLEQATPVWQTWPIAAGAVVSGTCAPGATCVVRFERRQAALTRLAFDDAGPGPRVRVLAFEPPGPGTPGSLTLNAAILGDGTGAPHQVVVAPRRPVIAASMAVATLEGAAWRIWQVVDDVAASTRTDAHVRLDATTGELTFGDGERGRVVPAGAAIVATFDTTDAEASVGTVIGLAPTPRTATLVARADVPGVAARAQLVLCAGAAAESLTHALGRAARSREAPLRAVTVDDIATTALETPGTRLARAMVRPNLYPGLPGVAAPGMVTVVLVPHLPASRPRPSDGLLSAVQARLDRRRAIGSRILVTGPRYVEIAVRASVRASDGVDRPRLGRQVAAALDAFFDPLGGGPVRAGWPLGRDVYRAEVLQVIDEVPGVEHVVRLELVVGQCAPTCGNVCVGPVALVAAGVHAIEVL